MILSFGDVHLGEHTYSKMDNAGFYTAELECIKSLECIYNRAKQSDIDLIICTGDFFHTNHPRPCLIKYAIGWFKLMDKLNKAFYIIPGNHDSSVYSNALMFMHKLTLNNIKLIDEYTIDYTTIAWGKYTIIFVPYIQDSISKNKDDATYRHIENACTLVNDNTIIVAHAVEPEATVGSEAHMLSKKVESISIDAIPLKNNIIFLLGHIHRHQIYKKGNGATIVYTGSTTYGDASDINQQKGYVTIDEAGTITFESINTIRKFNKYFIPDNKTAYEYFKALRLSQNSVIFIESNNKIDITKELQDIFISKNITVGKLTQMATDISSSALVYQTMDPYDISTAYINSLSIENAQAHIDYCHNKINKAIGGLC